LPSPNIFPEQAERRRGKTFERKCLPDRSRGWRTIPELPVQRQNRTIRMTKTVPPEVSYMAFVSDAPSNSRYHPLKVVVSGPERYSIQARPGYYADPPLKERCHPDRGPAPGG